MSHLKFYYLAPCCWLLCDNFIPLEWLPKLIKPTLCWEWDYYKVSKHLWKSHFSRKKNSHPQIPWKIWGTSFSFHLFSNHVLQVKKKKKKKNGDLLRKRTFIFVFALFFSGSGRVLREIGQLNGHTKTVIVDREQW